MAWPSNLLTSTGTGAVAGGTTGALFSPLGAGIGAAGGGFLGFLAGLYDMYNGKGNNGSQPGNQQEGKSELMQSLTGTPQGINKIPRFNEEQNKVLDAFLKQGQEGFNNQYEGFEPIADYARQSFQNKTVPEIMNAYTASGSNYPSTAPWNRIGEQGAAMEAQLGALRSQYGMQNRSQMLQLLSMGLTPRDAMYEQAAQAGAFDSVLPGVGRLMSEFGASMIVPLLKKAFGLEDTGAKKSLEQSAGNSGVPKTAPINPRQVAAAQMLIKQTPRYPT